MGYADTASISQNDSRTIGVIAVVSDRSEDVSLVFKFGDGLSRKERDGAARKLHEIAEGLSGVPPVVAKMDEI